MFQEERAEVGQRVVVAKQSPHAFLIIRCAAIKLHGLELRKLRNQGLVDHQPLVAVSSWRLILMLADALLQKLRHLEVRIAKQGRNAHHRRQHLGEKRPQLLPTSRSGRSL